MKAMPATKLSVKKVAAARSALRAFRSSSTYPPPSCSASSAGRSSWVATGAGVPITRLGTRLSSSGVASLNSLLSDILLLLLGLPGGEPRGCDDHQSDSDEPSDQALGHRADSAEAAAAGVGLLTGLR